MTLNQAILSCFNCYNNLKFLNNAQKKRIQRRGNPNCSGFNSENPATRQECLPAISLNQPWTHF